MIYTAVSGRAIPLGFLGENRVEAVVFDRTCWLTEYGPGTFELVHKRSQDTDPFPIAVTVSGGAVTWIPTESDTAYRGIGECQLSFYTPDGKLKKSEIYQTITARSLTSAEDPPSPAQGWVAEVLQAGVDAQLAQTGAEAAQAAADLAQGKAEDAQKAAERAQTAAETAQGLAEAAQTAAEDAQTAAETAQGKAEDAQTVAETAQTNAEAAQTAAETAQTNAEAAQGKAETAQGKAETAQTAAETAQVAAEAAAEAAEGIEFAFLGLAVVDGMLCVKYNA